MATTSTSVLFLPALQLPANRSQLRSAYSDGILEALRKSKPSESTCISRLDIAFLTDGGSDFPRHLIFSSFQTFFAEVYTLVCICAAQAGVDLDFDGGVDVRLVTLNLPCSNAEQASNGPTSVSTTGPLVTMTAWSRSRKSIYQHAFEVSSFVLPLRERNFKKYWESSDGASFPVEILQVPIHEGSYALHDTVTGTALSHIRGKSHTRIAVGGTFDHLHVGHKLLLAATIFIAEPGPHDRQITIGITGDELLVNKKYADVLESWDTRQQKVAHFVESILIFAANVDSIRTVSKVDKPGPNGKAVKVTYEPASVDEGGVVTVNYVQISDPFGPTITDETITALIISAETRAGGKAVNDKRVEKGWEPLEIFEVDVLDSSSGEDEPESSQKVEQKTFESKISSTEIRKRVAEAISNAATL